MTTFDLGLVTRKQDITPSTAYRAFLPGVQAVGSGSIVDRSGQGNDGSVLGANITDAQRWANAGHFSSIDGTDSAPGIPSSVSLFGNFNNREDTIFAHRIKMAAIGTTNGILGNFKTGSEGAGLRYTSSGANGIKIGISDGTLNAASAEITDVLDDVEHELVVAIDSVTKILTAYLDSIPAVTLDVSSVTGDISSSTLDFNFGNDGDIITASATYDGLFRDAHFIVPTGGLPSNILEIVNLYQSRHYIPFSTAEIGV